MKSHIERMSDFLNSDFKYHPSCFLEKDSDEHSSLEQRKENQRITKALRRLYPVFDDIWKTQLDLQSKLREVLYQERHSFNKHGLLLYFELAGKLNLENKEFVKLIKKHSNEPLVKEYYSQYDEFSGDMFDAIFSSDIVEIVKSRGESFDYDEQEGINAFKMKK